MSPSSYFREFANLLKNFWRITNDDVDSDKVSELDDVAQSRGRAAQRLRESGSGLNDHYINHEWYDVRGF